MKNLSKFNINKNKAMKPINFIIFAILLIIFAFLFVEYQKMKVQEKCRKRENAMEIRCIQLYIQEHSTDEYKKIFL